MSRRSAYAQLVAYPVALAFLNILIAHRMFAIEYTAHLESNEGTFIAIAREAAAHPFDLRWWPLWDCGLPFQNTYLPLLHLIVAFYTRLAGISAALAFHQVSATFYCLGPVALYFMARELTGRPLGSLVSAAAYSLVSPCAWLVPLIRVDQSGAWNLRRLQILGYYGEGPYTACLAFLPLAILFLYLALNRRSAWTQIGAVVFMGAAVLTNAFGATLLIMAGLSLIAAFGMKRPLRRVMLVAGLGLVAYCWISPLLPPSVIAAIRMNSPTVDGDFRFTGRSLLGLGILATAFVLIWLIARKTLPAFLQFFLLFALLATGTVMLGTQANIYVVPQPHRYQIAMDMGLCLAAVFGAVELGRFLPHWIKQGWPKGAAVALIVLLTAWQTRHDMRYARGILQSSSIASTAIYRIANWMDKHMDGRRVMIPGSYSFHFNDFTSTPQLHGGHDPMLPNFVMRIAMYVLYHGTPDPAEDAATSILWLKALGVHAVLMPGPHSEEYYKPFTNPAKFNDILPVIWRDGDDTLFEVPAASGSLARVLPAATAVRHTPVNGIDLDEIRRYDSALDDPNLPLAQFTWQSHSRASVQARMQPDQELSVQVTYSPGWHASANGKKIPVEKDGLGLILLHPSCNGPCDIGLVYDGGLEWKMTCAASFAMVLLAAGILWRARGIKPPPPQ